MKRALIILAFLSIAFLPAKAQVDAHFTQYYMYPLFLNPGLTGVISGGDMRVAAIYRNQWSSITNPFSTVGVSGDMLLDNNWGLGVNLINQTAGNGGYKNTNAHISLANHNLRLGVEGTHHISLGLQLGLIAKSFDATKLQFGDQFNPVLGFNPGSTSGAIGSISNFSESLFDVGAGAAYFDETPDQQINAYGGVALSHINQPKDQFTITKNGLPTRMTLHAGARINVSPTVLVYPNIIYMSQGNAYEAVPSMHVEMKADESTSLLLGASLRLKDAMNAFAGVYYKSYSIGLSYDVSVSSLKSSSRQVNGFELSLSYTGLKAERPDTRYFKCPRF